MSIYKRDDSQSWWIAVCVLGRAPVRMSTDTTDKREAERVERRVRRELEEGTFNRTTRTRLTLREAFDLALATHWAQAKSLHSVTSVARVICAILGDDLPLDAVDARAVTRLKDGMKDRGVAHGTINRKLAALQKVLNLARDEWHMELGAVSFRGKKEKEAKGRLRWLTDREEVDLLTLAGVKHPEYADLFAFLIDTGCRFSEAQRLTERHILVDPAAVRLVGTKNGDERVVPLTARARTILAGRPGALPWGNLSLDQAERVWQAVRASMGLSEDKEFVIHALRHTFASRLVQRGVRIEVVSKLLGHKTIQQTMVYAHLDGHNYRDAIDVLNVQREVKREVTCCDVRVRGEMEDVKSLTGVGFSHARVAELVDARDLKCLTLGTPSAHLAPTDQSLTDDTSTPPERDVK